MADAAAPAAAARVSLSEHFSEVGEVIFLLSQTVVWQRQTLAAI